MGFFVPPPGRPESEYRAPAWLLPPEDVLPGVVPVELLMVRTMDRAVLFTDILAYPSGFGFTVSVRLRQDPPQPHPGVGDVDEPDALVERYLRFGVRFADGRTATNHADRLMPTVPETSRPETRPAYGDHDPW